MNFPTSVTSARTFQLQRNIPILQKTLQYRWVLSNLNGNFPTSRSFQLPFPTTCIPFYVYGMTWLLSLDERNSFLKNAQLCCWQRYVGDNFNMQTIKKFCKDNHVSPDLFGHQVSRLVCNYFCECWSYLIPSIRFWFRFWPFEISYSESKMSNKKYFRFSESDLIKIFFLCVRTFSPKNCMSHL